VLWRKGNSYQQAGASSFDDKAHRRCPTWLTVSSQSLAKRP
jgi:hypothetical protein